MGQDNSFISGLTNAATGGIGGLIGTGLGLLLEGHNDRRQLKQQEKLQALQIQGQKEMTDYNSAAQYELQHKMWDSTNYEAQMQHIKNAGLNPSLLYGTSGGGGVTTGGGLPQGSVSGTDAPKGGMEILAAQQQMMQLKLLEAQKENIQADTANKQADTKNKPLQGSNIEASTASLTQGIENQKAIENLTKIQAGIAEIEKGSKKEVIDTNIEKLNNEIVQLWNNNYLFAKTKEDKIALIKQEVVNAILTGESIKSGIEVNKEQINKMSEEIAQGWKKLTIDQYKAQIDASFKGIGQIAGNLIQQVFQKIDDTTGKQNDMQPNKMNK